MLLKRIFKRERTERGGPITDCDYVVIDTELTGLNERRDSIISIGAIRMRGQKIYIGETFYRTVRPTSELSIESVVVHEITPSEVIYGEEVKDVLSDFSEFCGSDIIVGYFTLIDLSFINREMKRFFYHPLPNPVLDIFVIYEWLRAREKITGPQRFKLYEIARDIGISVNGAHNALMDAFITAQVFQRFIPMLLEAGIENREDLLRVGDPVKGGDSLRIKGTINNF